MSTWSTKQQPQPPWPWNSIAARDCLVRTRQLVRVRTIDHRFSLSRASQAGCEVENTGPAPYFLSLTICFVLLRFKRDDIGSASRCQGKYGADAVDSCSHESEKLPSCSAWIAPSIALAKPVDLRCRLALTGRLETIPIDDMQYPRRKLRRGVALNS